MERISRFGVNRPWFRAAAAFALAASLAFSTAAQETVQARVNVTSQPSGATVIVDGKDRGTTPITLFDLRPGRHHIKYRLAGYGEADRYVDTLREGPFIEKNVVLQEIKGLLLLKTVPEGASIVIDGLTVGQTPRLVTHLSAKDVYNVRLRKAGYQDQTIQVRFDGRRPLVREETLVPASGTVNVMSDPAGAEVTVNGIVRGKTPVTVGDVPRGRAVVKFSLDGFEDEVRELAIKAGDVQTLSVPLRGRPGTLMLTSVPEGARFYVNDEPRGRGPLAIPGLKSGEYVVRAEMDGYASMTKTIAIDNGVSTSEEFRLSNVMGRLEVCTSPVGAQVWLDGRLVGMTKSKDADATFSDILAVENVLEGEHTLVVKKEGFADATLHPKVMSSQTTKCHRVRLARIFTPDTEIVTTRGTYTGVLVANTPDAVVMEVKMGITQSFARSEIRKVTFLNQNSGGK